MLSKVSDYQPKITIQSKPIKQVFESNTLGVIVGQHLSWKINTDNIYVRKLRLEYAL